MRFLSVLRLPTDALGTISCPLRSRGIWCIISVVLVLAVTDTGVWVLLLSTEKWIFREMFVVLGAMLGSTVDTVYASTLAFGRTAAFLLHSV